MKEAEKEADKIIEMFGSKAILHVEGIIKAVDKREQYIVYCLYEPNGFPIEDKFWQQVKQAIENK